MLVKLKQKRRRITNRCRRQTRDYLSKVFNINILKRTLRVLVKERIING